MFDVCPSPPLIWNEFGAQNLIELARAGVAVEMISMPLVGEAEPVTLLGSVVQHAAEFLSGIAIHQLAKAGAPIVCGGLDPRCPAVDSIAARDKLLLLGKSGDFLLYPDEGHIFLKMENVLEAETRRAEFLARHIEHVMFET